MNFLNQYLRSKINKTKKKKQKKHLRIVLKNRINKEKYGKITNKFIQILIFKMTKKLGIVFYLFNHSMQISMQNKMKSNSIVKDIF